MFVFSCAHYYSIISRLSVEIWMLKVSLFKGYYHLSSQDLFACIPYFGMNKAVSEWSIMVVILMGETKVC
jgi:hypothetical protein